MSWTRSFGAVAAFLTGCGFCVMMQAVESAGTRDAAGRGNRAVRPLIMPSNLVVSPGSNVTFSVSTGGRASAKNTIEPILFQWRKDGAEIPGATNGFLNLPEVDSRDAGRYDVVLRNPVAVFVSDGHSGSALRMKGPIRVPNVPELAPAEQVTVQAWVRASSLPGRFRYLMVKSCTPKAGSYALYTGAQGSANFYVQLQEGSTINSPYASTNIWDGQWHQLTGVYDGAAVRLYVDGSEIGNGTPVHKPLPLAYDQAYQNGDLILGDYSYRIGNNHYGGDLDEVRIYRRALTPAEIARSYTNNESLSNLVTWFRGDNDFTNSVGNCHGVPSPAPAVVLSEPSTVTVTGPAAPTLISPASNAVITSGSVKLEVDIGKGTNRTVKFYGRLTSEDEKDFTIVVLPDTQYYAANHNGGSSAMLDAQIDWILSNRSKWNIAYVAQLGDLVENGDKKSGKSNLEEWRNVTNAFYRLESVAGLHGGIPYGLAVGNHDQTPNSDENGTTHFYNQFFGIQHFQERPYYGGHFGDNNDNHFDLFSAGGIDFIVLYLEYADPMSPEVLKWGNETLKAHLRRKAIVVSHCLTGTGNPSRFWDQGDAIYQSFRTNQNLFLMLCGHVTGDGIREDVYNGQTVFTLLADYQASGNGGNGYLRWLQFSPKKNVIRVLTYSPWTGLYQTDADSQFTLPFAMQSSSNAFQLLGKVEIGDDVRAALTWPESKSNKVYEWYATVTEGTHTSVSPVWSFRR